jgi:glycosyltransferase involved in cell wall biosynthesis
MEKISVLQVHNYYQQPGGEDTVFESEVTLLRERNHRVATFEEHNDRIRSLRPAALALQTVYSQPSYHRLLEVLTRERPDIVHFHNTFPLISPSAYYACRKSGIPVIQSLHNPRLICPAASFYREGRNCTDCLGKKLPYPAVVHACYHNSYIHTSGVVAMLALHRLRGTWAHAVDRYVVASTFYQDLFTRAGLPAEKIVRLPHFVTPTVPYREDRPEGNYALFVGRLDPEKGVGVLLEAWQESDVPLKVRGSGAMEGEVREFIDRHPTSSVELIGRLSRDDLYRLIAGARFLVWPSSSEYETFGFVAVESFSLGVPVISSRIGVNQEMVREGETGLLFTPGDARDLAGKVRWAWDHPRELAVMGRQARGEYEAKYTVDRHYDSLIQLYQQALEAQPGRR